MSSVGNYEDLNVFKKTATGEETFAWVAFNLIKCLAEPYAASFKFNMDEGKAINKNRYVVAIIMFGAFAFTDGVLINDL